MGLFHCPLGAAFYDDEPCIDCGLCSAKTKEEMVRASQKIREYLRCHIRRTEGPSRKIAVCGKGGAGKSTVVILLARALRDIGYQVIVIDTDESNAGLTRLLGFGDQPMPLVATRGGPWLCDTEPQTNWLERDEILSRQIPKEYLREADSLKFLIAGKIADPFQGCACSVADAAREFIEKLVLNDKEIVLIDVEAGIESFGRGVERGADTVLIVVEPSFESIALAERINYMAQGLGIKKVQAVLNKIPSEKLERRIGDELKNMNVNVVGTICLDGAISEAGLEGEAILGAWTVRQAERITRIATDLCFAASYSE